QLNNLLINKNNDISYLIDTSIRGKIAIINEDYELIAYASLDKTIKVTYEDYILNKTSNSYEKAEALKIINEIDFTKLKADAYLYHLIDLDVLKCPKLIDTINETQIWVEFDEENSQNGYKQISLFDI
ncbi:MAG: hypothetical protein K6E20_00890, partial [Acholeplasmatales bacterium]|nr:hypothetical protein [Acholeplasmatales bacterium]